MSGLMLKNRPAAVMMFAAALLAVVLLLVGCGAAAEPAAESGPAATAEGDHDNVAHEDELEPLVIPALAAASLDGRALRVLATTSFVGDAAARVGGDAIELTTLMGPGQDPHSYQPGAADLTAAADADVILVNGWNLEEGLADDLATIAGNTAIVPVSAGIMPLAFGVDGDHGHEDAHADEADHAAEADHADEADHAADEADDHGPADPHVWQSVPNMIQWVETIRQTLGALDPANAAVYDANAAAYTAELQALDAEIRARLETIPAERRVLVTNHGSFGYFAAAYGFEVLGTVVPSVSTVSETTAADLAALSDLMKAEGVCSVFTETTSSTRLAETLAGELDGCDSVQVLQLYTGSLGPAGSGAETFSGMMRANVETLVQGLQ